MNRLKFVLKLVIAAFIIWLVKDQFNLTQFKYILTDPMLLVVIPVCWCLNLLLTTLRLHAILHMLRRPTRLADVFSANMSSLFVGNLMPGVVGADIVKFFYLKKHDSSIGNTELALILGFDRILGLLTVLFLCSFFSFFVNGNTIGSDTKTTYLLTYMPITALVLIILSLVALDFGINFLLEFKLPTIIRDFIKKYQHIKKISSKRSLVLVMFYSIFAVFVILTGLVFVGAQLQLQQHAEAMVILQFFLIPLTLVAASLPLTPMGIGVAQITMAGAYGLFGLDSSIGVSISTLSQLGLLSVSVLVGGTVFITSGLRPKYKE